MKRNLGVKIQKISPALPPRSNSFSSIFTIAPESDETSEKKGYLYILYNLSTHTDLEIALANKIVFDVIKESYYLSDNISPIQSLEKAVADVREKVFRLTNDQNATFDITCVALWGNVIYYVQYGKGSGFLVREGDVKTINVNSEGKYSTASGIIKNDDVLILCTDTFGQAYTPAKMLNTPISTQTLLPEASCLILKFQVETHFSTEEVINFAPSKNIPIKRDLVVEKIKDYWDKVLNTISSAFKKSLKAVFTILNRKSPAVKIGALLLGVCVIAGGVFFFSGKNTTPPSESEKTNEKINEEVEGAKTTAKETEQNMVVLTTDLDKTIRDVSQVYYDIKLADTNTNPTYITFVNNNVVVVDATQGTVFVSNADTPKFVRIQNTFSGISNISDLNRNLRFIDSNTYNVLDISQNKIIQKLNIKPTGPVANYLDYIYAIFGDTVRRYNDDTDTISTTWAQSSDFQDARAMSIAISIYIINKDGKLVKYTRGEKDSFDITGISTLGPLDKIIANVDYEYLYALDKTGKRFIQLEKNGTFVKQYRYSSTADWNDLKDFTISSDEKSAYVLDGSVVYKVAL